MGQTSSSITSASVILVIGIVAGAFVVLPRSVRVVVNSNERERKNKNETGRMLQFKWKEIEIERGREGRRTRKDDSVGRRYLH